MDSGILLKFVASHHAVVLLLVSRTHPGLANRTGAIVGVAMASCQECSSKLYWSFVTFEQRFLQQRWLHKNYISEAATMVHGLNFSGAKGTIELLYNRPSTWTLLAEDGLCFVSQKALRKVCHRLAHKVFLPEIGGSFAEVRRAAQRFPVRRSCSWRHLPVSLAKRSGWKPILQDASCSHENLLQSSRKLLSIY